MKTRLEKSTPDHKCWIIFFKKRNIKQLAAEKVIRILQKKYGEDIFI